MASNTRTGALARKRRRAWHAARQQAWLVLPRGRLEQHYRTKRRRQNDRLRRAAAPLPEDRLDPAVYEAFGRPGRGTVYWPPARPRRTPTARSRAGPAEPRPAKPPRVTRAQRRLARLSAEVEAFVERMEAYQRRAKTAKKRGARPGPPGL